MFSDADHITLFKPMGVDQLLIDEGAIFALQVNQNKPVPHRVYLGMMTRDSQVINDDIIVFATADRYRMAFVHLVISKGIVFKFQR
jgi:hypothetical protein